MRDKPLMTDGERERDWRTLEALMFVYPLPSVRLEMWSTANLAGKNTARALESLFQGRRVSRAYPDFSFSLVALGFVFRRKGHK